MIISNTKVIDESHLYHLQFEFRFTLHNDELIIYMGWIVIILIYLYFFNNFIIFMTLTSPCPPWISLKFGCGLYMSLMCTYYSRFLKTWGNIEKKNNVKEIIQDGGDKIEDFEAIKKERTNISRLYKQKGNKLN